MLAIYISSLLLCLAAQARSECCGPNHPENDENSEFCKIFKSLNKDDQLMVQHYLGENCDKNPEEFMGEIEKRKPNFLRFGKRSDAPASDYNVDDLAAFYRIAKKDDVAQPTFLRFGKADADNPHFLRFGKRSGADPNFLRFGKRKPNFLRFGKRKPNFLRFGKRDSDEMEREIRKPNFLRFGKRKPNFLRFGKRKPNFLRFG